MKRAILLALCTLLQTALGEVVYAPGVNQSDINDGGSWTVWMNSDEPTGVGELEDVWEQQYKDGKTGQCEMFCDEPIAMEVRPANPAHVWDEIRQCTVQDLNPVQGYWCENSDNYDTASLPAECVNSYCAKNNLNSLTGKCRRCPNVEVRYFCVGDKAELIAETCGVQKKRQMDRKDWEQNYMKKMLANIEAQKKREEKEAETKREEKAPNSLTKLLRKLMKELDD